MSPDGKFVITGNTLTGTITIIDAVTDTLVKSLTCDPGCHGVNFGAKEGGGYYAYITSKFSNRLIVLDYDPNNDGNVADAVIASWVVLDDSAAPAPIDDTITGNKGMGGQRVLPVPNVYNGWVQKLPKSFCDQLSLEQRNPIGAPVGACYRISSRCRDHPGTEHSCLAKDPVTMAQHHRTGFSDCCVATHIR